MTDHEHFLNYARAMAGASLDKCEHLRVALEKFSDLFDLLLAGSPLEVVVNEPLRAATIACLQGLSPDTKEYKNSWNTAKEVLAWLAVAAVKEDWIKEFEAKNNNLPNGYIELPIDTELGAEVVNSRLLRRKMTFPINPSRSELFGVGSFKTPNQTFCYSLEKSVDALLLSIWNQVFPHDSISCVTDKAKARLNKELALRKANQKEHHYLLFLPETNTPLSNKEYLAAVLASLPNLTVIRAMGPQETKPLQTDDEYYLEAIFRSFLEIPAFLETENSWSMNF